MLLPAIGLPLRSDGPPSGYSWNESDISEISNTAAFSTRLSRRDTFLGSRRCVICGMSSRTVLEHCHIISREEDETWTDLKRRNWIPSRAKYSPEHEPRNGLIMCSIHHKFFDNYEFFIRFVPEIQKFLLVNYSENSYLSQHHGKAIALDIYDRYAPFPSLFIIQEMRVRGFHPFQSVTPVMPNDVSWQDWITSDGVVNESGALVHGRHPNMPSIQPPPQFQFMPLNTGNTAPSSGGHTLALNEDVISEILAATRAMPSWRACQIEGTSWSGTAEENIDKYVTTIGLQGDES